MSHLPAGPLNRDEAVPCADDPLQLNGDLLDGVKPGPRCPGQSLMTVIGLTDLIWQDVALVDELRIEQGHVLAARPFRWVPSLKEGSKPLQVQVGSRGFLRHRLTSIPLLDPRLAAMSPRSASSCPSPAVPRPTAGRGAPAGRS